MASAPRVSPSSSCESSSESSSYCLLVWSNFLRREILPFGLTCYHGMSIPSSSPGRCRQKRRHSQSQNPRRRLADLQVATHFLRCRCHHRHRRRWIGWVWPSSSGALLLPRPRLHRRHRPGRASFRSRHPVLSLGASASVSGQTFPGQCQKHRGHSSATGPWTFCCWRWPSSWDLPSGGGRGPVVHPSCAKSGGFADCGRGWSGRRRIANPA